MTLIAILILILLQGCKSAEQNNNLSNETKNSETNPPATENYSEHPNQEIPSNEKQIIVISDFLMGGVMDKEWLQPNEIEKSIQGGEKYNIYGLNCLVGEATGGVVSDEEPNNIKMVTITYKEKLPLDYVAIAECKNPLPRTATVETTNNETYSEIIRGILTESGIDNANISIKQVFRVDLDGDGTDEALITADNIDTLGTSTQKGTYSFILLRKIVNGTVSNIFIEKGLYATDGSYSEGGPTSREIVGFFDLNGDGNMEIVTKYKYYEGYGYNVYEVKGEKVSTVLSNGFGA